MRKKIYGALGALALSLTMLVQTSTAQIYGEFETVKVVQENYTPIIGGTVHASTEFKSGDLGIGGVTDKDDGYKKITLPFTFEFNGDNYDEVWVNVNGYVQFLKPGVLPLSLPQKLGTRLFTFDNSSVAYNVVAPFWGDHFYRDGGDISSSFTPSSIITQALPSLSSATVFTIEWKDLQVNRDITNLANTNLQSSIANFQVKFYKSTISSTKQGDIEFCYGLVGNNPRLPSSTTITDVITRNASIGVKGDVGDFINALHNDVFGTPALAKSSTILTTGWQPSGGSNRRLRYIAKRNFNVAEFWGDGDADFSKAEGRPHAAFFNVQNRYVTINDVRVILRSVARRIPLDSIRRRAAFHADVTHNGRFYYNGGVRTSIPNRDLNYDENLPAGISSEKVVYYQANEFDAAIILNYLSAKLPSLPWRYDTVPLYGKEKFDGAYANSIKLGTSVKDNGIVRLPISLNGRINGALGVKFNVNGEIVNVVGNGDNKLAFDFDGNTVVIAGAGEFAANEEIAYLDVRTTSNEIKLTDINFNDNQVGEISTLESLEDNGANLMNTPNPFNTTTDIKFDVAVSGNYALAIYDVYGKLVKELSNNFLNAGKFSFNWDGTTLTNESAQSGMYVAKLTSGNNTYTVKMVLTK